MEPAFFTITERGLVGGGPMMLRWMRVFEKSNEMCRSMVPVVAAKDLCKPVFHCLRLLRAAFSLSTKTLENGISYRFTVFVHLGCSGPTVLMIDAFVTQGKIPLFFLDQ